MKFNWEEGNADSLGGVHVEEVEEFVDHCNMVIIPVGAIEQHGPHLPLMTDTAQALEISKRVSANTGVPVVPPVAVGISQSHGNFPGTLWVRVDTMISLLYDLCTSLYESGIRKFFFINGHMYNDWGIKGVRDHFRCDYDDVQITTVNYWQTTETRFAEDCPQNKHIHGNFGETAQMLVIRPDLVKMDRAEDTPASSPSSTIASIRFRPTASSAATRPVPRPRTARRCWRPSRPKSPSWSRRGWRRTFPFRAAMKGKTSRSSIAAAAGAVERGRGGGRCRPGRRCICDRDRFGEGEASARPAMRVARNSP